MESSTPASFAKAILQDALTMTLAVSDADGPWAAPLVFINPDSYDVCWVSVASARHSLALANGTKAAVSIVASDSTTAERALQMSVQVEKVEESNLAWEQMLAKKRGFPVPQSAGSLEKVSNGTARALRSCT